MKLLATLFLFLLTTSSALAADEPEEMEFGEVSRRSLKVQNDPCYEEHGAARRICVIEWKKGTAIEREESIIGRRAQALLDAKSKNRSVLVPKWMTEPKRIDLRSSSEQMQELLKNRKMAGKTSVKQEEEKTPTVRIRAKSGTRADPVAIPVCTRRHGLMLVTCLKEMGIEVSPETVDPPTWEIYRQSQMPTQQ